MFKVAAISNLLTFDLLILNFLIIKNHPSNEYSTLIFQELVKLLEPKLFKYSYQFIFFKPDIKYVKILSAEKLCIQH